MAKTRSFFSRGRKVLTADRFVSDLQQAGLIMQRAGSSDGGDWIVDGKSLRNFGSCSYLGLEMHPALISGAERALHTYGSNFSISRAYVECPLYTELEALLEQMTERAVVVAPSTTLGHMAALPVLIGDNDLVLIDQFAHASLHMATDLITDVNIELLRHSRMDQLEQKLQQAGSRYERVWYICDGVYSMLGDFAPFAELAALLDRYPRLHLYVDDAHATSWIGRHGRGAALAQLGHSDRVTVALSLNKAFGAVGGALALPSAELRDRVRRCGGPMVFSGPIAPAGLGAAVASARLHLSSGLDALQQELAERIRMARSWLAEYGLQTATDAATPIFMLHFDSTTAAGEVVKSLRASGFFTCVSTFPAVPVNKPSVRFTVSRHNGIEHLRALIEQLAQSVVSVSDTEDTLPRAAVS